MFQFGYVDYLHKQPLMFQFGYVDVNLAECAGAGTLSRRYLVRGYESKKHRQDNSILNVSRLFLISVLIEVGNSEWGIKIKSIEKNRMPWENSHKISKVSACR